MQTATDADLDPVTSTDAAALGQAALQRVNAGQFGAARPLVERALALEPDNPLLVHVKAHLCSDSAALDEGASYLRDFLARHDPFRGINVHTSWHLALIELERARPTAALDWYRRVVAPTLPIYPMTFFAAVTILWRLELYGYGAVLRAGGEQLPWEDVRTAALGIDDASPLYEVGRAMAFLATGDEASLVDLIARLRTAGPSANVVTAEVALPFIEGLRPFWQGDYAAAVERMAPIAAAFGRISEFPDHRNVFDDTVVEAHLRAGRFGWVEAALAPRLAAVPLPRYHYWLGLAQRGLGKTAEAAGSLRAARNAWREADPDAPEIVAVESLLAAA